MAMGDRIPTRAEELSLKGQQTVGDATGNEDLKADGEQDQATGVFEAVTAELAKENVVFDGVDTTIATSTSSEGETA